ncbi:MAG: AMP-binding protein, partial [Gammaproteobacteria bacterium]|nr:AMP-binding protein [Gammaproteobacteria bacterium]
GAPVIEGYGQSEAGPVISFNPLDGPRKPFSVGLPLPGTKVEIVALEDRGTRLPAGEAGEIRVRGPQIMRGYRGDPKASAAALADGWLYTGDIGEFDDDGYLYIRGRCKELIIVSGYNVYPREIEEILHAHPQVREAAVVGIPDDYRGEQAVAFIVPETDAPRDKAELEAMLTPFLGERLARYKLPSAFLSLETLPRTGVGKVDKSSLEQRAMMEFHEKTDA